MPDPYRRVRAGEPFAPSATQFNTFVDAAKWVNEQRRSPGAGRSDRPGAEAAVVLVRNGTEDEVPRFGVLGIDAPAFTPTESEEYFKGASPFALRGVLPAAEHRGGFVVTLEPIAAGEYGRAVISGICVAKLDVEQEGYDRADVKPGSAQVLATGSTGSARILWVEEGTGEKWAYVLLGGGGGQEWFPGVIACEGPDGEGDFGDNRYWVQRARVSNGEGDAANAKVTFEALAADHPQFWHGAVTNQFEDNCGTHNVRPGTFVTVFVERGPGGAGSGGGEGASRYWMVVADEGICRAEPCPPPSSSGSSGSSRSGSSGSSGPSTSLSASQEPSGSGSSTGTPSGSSAGTPSSEPGSSAGTPSSASGGGGGSSGGGGGSGKSSAIVPASWTGTGYAALFVSENPDVRFDDVMAADISQEDVSLPIDPRFIEVCAPDSIEVCSVSSDLPLALGALVDGDRVRLRFADHDPDQAVRVVVRLSGVRKGFQGVRFPARTREQFEANERFIKSAYIQ